MLAGRERERVLNRFKLRVKQRMIQKEIFFFKNRIQCNYFLFVHHFTSHFVCYVYCIYNVFIRILQHSMITASPMGTWTMHIIFLPLKLSKSLFLSFHLLKLFVSLSLSLSFWCSLLMLLNLLTLRYFSNKKSLVACLLRFLRFRCHWSSII